MKGGSEGPGRCPPRGPPLLIPGESAHGCLPAEDVAVEADPVLGEIKAALEEDLALQGTGVI